MSLKETLESADNIKYEILIKWFTKETVIQISASQKEPDRMLKHRLKCFEQFQKMSYPKRWPSLSGLDLNDIVYYAKPSKDYEWYANNRDDVPQEIKEKFQKLGIPEAEQKYLSGAGWQYDSLNVYHKIKDQRAAKGVIFEDMPQALRSHSELVKKYFMSVVPATDHIFAALHGAVWSGWTFVYIPKWVQLDDPLQAYFRMNTYAGWQFEHTLIIVDDEAKWSYIEWCSAPKFDKASLHAGLVEIIVGKNSKMKYSSVENRSTNTYNLNTKRAIVEERGYMERVNWNMWSCTTMLYPCSVLKWDYSKTDMLGIAVASKGQNQDTWSKVIHIWKYTSSTIISKTISKDWWISTYRWLVKITKNSEYAVNHTECDALLLDDDSVSITIPDIICNTKTWIVAHEASAGKVDDNEIFYLTARWIPEEKAIAMIVNGFFSSVVKKLPLEYAWELNKLIEMEMEWSIW